MADEQQQAKATTANVRDPRTPFSSYLIDIDRGRVEADATDEIAKVIRAVEHTRKAGTVTITVKIAPQDPKTFEDTGTLVVEGDVKSNPPRITRAPSIFYATGVDGQMTRQDPHRDDPRDA